MVLTKKINTFLGLLGLYHSPDPQLPFYMSLARLWFVSQKTNASIFFLYYPLYICICKKEELLNANGEQMQYARETNKPRDHLQIMCRVQKMVKRALACENFLKIQLKINKFEKHGTLFLKMRKVACNIWTLN